MIAPTASPFCEHKRLRTSCPTCRPPPPPEAPKKAPKPKAEKAEKEEKAQRMGELKPPIKTKKRVASAKEADQAEAWWVKK